MALASPAPYTNPQRCSNLWRLLLFVFSVFLGLHAYAQTLKVLEPKKGVTVAGSAAKIHLQMERGADLSRLKIRLNGKDISAEVAGANSCSSDPCDVAADISTSSALTPSWNVLNTTHISSDNKVAVDTTSFYVKANDVSSTPTVPNIPFLVNFQVANINGQITISYIANGVQKTILSTSCPHGQVLLTTVDRTSLMGGLATCMPPSSLHVQSTDNTEFVIIVAGDDSTSVQGVDFSPWGGSNFSVSALASATAGLFSSAVNSTTVPFAYKLIGYGGGNIPAGSAYESFGTNTQNSVVSYPQGGTTLQGTLYNVKSSGTGHLYSFRPNDAPSFDLAPLDGNGYTLSLRYTATDSNQPSSQTGFNGTFTSNDQNVTGTCSPCDTWLITFDPTTLGFIGSNKYNLTNNTDQQYLAQLLVSLPNQSVFFLSHWGGLSDPAKNAHRISSELASALIQVGGSAHDFNDDNFYQKPYAMVGIAQQDMHPSTPRVDRTYAGAFSAGTDETGRLHGLLEHDHQYFFKPANVTPYTTEWQKAGVDPYQRDTFRQVFSAPTVPWPGLANAAQQQAYETISYHIEMLQKIIDPSIVDCSQTGTHCDDVRYYYTGDLNQMLTDAPSLVFPESVQTTYCPDSAPVDPTKTSLGSLDDCQTVMFQINNELAYVGYIKAYQVTEKTLPADLNLSGQVTAAATYLSQQIDDIQTNAVSSSSSALQLSADGLNIGGVLGNAPGLLNGLLEAGDAALPEFDFISEMLYLGAAVEQVAQDSNGPSAAPVTMPFSSILNQTDQAAENAANAYVTSITNGSNEFYNAIYSDWYKMEWFGSQVAPGGPLFPQAAGADTSYQQLVSQSLMYSFYKQMLPVFFARDSYPGVALVTGQQLNGSQYMYYDMRTLVMDQCYSHALFAQDFDDSVLQNPALGIQDGLYTESYWYPNPTVKEAQLYVPYSAAAYPAHQIPTGYLGYGTPGTLNDLSDLSVIRFTDGYGANGQPFLINSALMNLITGVGSAPSGAPASGPLNIPSAWFFDSSLLPVANLPCPISPTLLNGSGSSAGLLGAAAPTTTVTLTGSFDPEGDLTLTANAVFASEVGGTGTMDLLGQNGKKIQSVPSQSSGTSSSASFLIPVASLVPNSAVSYSAQYDGDNINQAGKSAAASFQVNAAAVQITPASYSIFLAPGASQTIPLNITVAGGFLGPLNLSCSVAPNNPAANPPNCTLDSSTVQITPGVTPPTIHATITASSLSASNNSSSFEIAGGLALSIVCIIPGSLRKKRLGISLALAIFALGASLGLSGCGGAALAPTEMYHVQITASTPASTAMKVSANTTITLNVNPGVQ